MMRSPFPHSSGFFLLFFLVLNGVGLLVCQQIRNKIQLQNGEYSNIVVAIQKDVPENTALIENLKDIFIKSAPLLYSATNNNVFWREMTILVPLTWTSRQEYDKARLEKYESSNILVSDTTEEFVQPYVQNPFGCGKEGSYIHLSSRYILDPDIRRGVTDKAIVRQWAKFRWGIFDEHYEPYMSRFGAMPCYISTDGPNQSAMQGTRCSMEIQGRCKSSDSTFEPISEQMTMTSLMFGSHDFDSITSFCNESQHNSQAPNIQNLFCRHRSAWTVMNESLDFTNENQSARMNFTLPSFRVVQTTSPRVVLILDTSGSMRGSRFENMIRATTIYLRDSVQAGSSVGIVKFNVVSTITSGLIKITDHTNREHLVDSLPQEAGGSTCIGCGILDAIKVLKEGSEEAVGGYLILLSDGRERDSPYISETIDDIDNAGVIIDTIAISNSADHQMEDIAARTGGFSTFCSDASGPGCVVSAFTRTISARPEQSVEPAPIQIFSSTVSVSAYTTTVVSTIIDASIGNDTVITFTATEGHLVTVTLNGPDGTRVTSTDSRYQLDMSTGIITIRLATAAAGQWNASLFSKANTDVSVTVNSKPVSSDPFEAPAIATAFLGSREVDYLSLPFLIVFGHVHKNLIPVLNARVVAYIDDSVGSNGNVTLTDDGKAQDIFTDDGIYTAAFQELKRNGRYNVRVVVEGMYYLSSEIRGVRVEREASMENTTIAPSVVTTSFMRTASAGSFEVFNFVPNAPDITAPSRIQDLMLSGIFRDGNVTISLTWTAVGDDLNQGTAFRYEIRYSSLFSALVHNFNESVEITARDIYSGNLSSVSPAGTREQITLYGPEESENTAISYAIRVWDEAENAGDVSNIVSVSPPLPTPTPNFITDGITQKNAPTVTELNTQRSIQTTVQSTMTIKRNQTVSSVLLLAVCVPIAVLIAILIVLLVRKTCCANQATYEIGNEIVRKGDGDSMPYSNPTYEGTFRSAECL